MCRKEFGLEGVIRASGKILVLLWISSGILKRSPFSALSGLGD